MSRKASPTLIGAFVVGAVVLSVLALIVLGAGRYFRKTYDFVLYFGGSVNGLQVGAPVRYKGVEVGSVKDIRLQVDSGMEVQRIPVIIEIDPDKITSRGYSSRILSDPRFFDDAVNRGLRGQLQLESFVTGVLFVALDMFPNTPANYVQQPGRGRYRYREIPTEPNPLERARGAVDRVLAKLADTDFESFVDSATRAVAAINELVSSPELRATIRSSGDVTHRLGDAAANLSRLATSLDGQVDSLSGDVRLTTAAAREAIKHAQDVIDRTDATINDSPTAYELDKTLQELSAAARSLRLLTGYLERNPSALVLGRPVSKEER
jgi:paraquat-inducible protein B